MIKNFKTAESGEAGLGLCDFMGGMPTAPALADVQAETHRPQERAQRQKGVALL